MACLRIALCLCLITIVPRVSDSGALNLPVKQKQSSPGTFEVRWSGRLSRVHLDGDASPNIRLQDIEGPTGLFAIGPLAGLRGEITVDGAAFIARADGDTIQVSDGFNVEASFLVYGNVLEWKAVPVPDTVQSVKDLERWLLTAVKAAGIDAETEVFPFKITTSQSDIDYHIISNRKPGYSITQPHRELMRSFEIRSQPLTLLGVFSKSHAGIFTHHDEWTHIHVVSGDGKFSGHVDSIVLGSDAMLCLPKR